MLDRLSARIRVALTGRYQRSTTTGGHLLQDSQGHAGQRRARRPQLPVRGCAGQTGGYTPRVPQQPAVCPAGHQSVVRRPQPDPQLPRAEARCDQPVVPGQVIPAPSINNGLNPMPADRLPGTPPRSAIRCSGRGPAPSNAMGSSPTRASTPRATFRQRSIVRKAVSF